MAAPATKKVLIPIANGTEPMEAVITIDVLRRSGAEVTVASVEKNLRVDASLGIKLVADALLVDCEGSSFDLISLPGGMIGADRLRDCGALESIVKKHVEKGGLYAAICAAPAVALGSWGLLKGLKATCYPLVMDRMPSDVIKVESRVVVDGRAVTSRGPGTAIEFALALVEQLYGKDKAAEVARPMEGFEQDLIAAHPAASTGSAVGSVASLPTDFQLWKKSTGGTSKKGRVYGLGSAAAVFEQASTSSSAPAPRSDMVSTAQLETLLENMRASMAADFAAKFEKLERKLKKKKRPAVEGKGK